MNENEKKATGNRVEAFFAGKGFYIVLLLCVAVIGVSAWSMLSGGTLEDGGDTSLAVYNPVEEDDAVATGKTAPVVVPERPSPTPAPTPAPTPVPMPETVPAVMCFSAQKAVKASRMLTWLSRLRT